jgi:hypothetical protein
MRVDKGDVVGGTLLVSGCDGPVVFEFVEEAFDEVLWRYRKGPNAGALRLLGIGLTFARASWASITARSPLLS